MLHCVLSSVCVCVFYCIVFVTLCSFGFLVFYLGFTDHFLNTCQSPRTAKTSSEAPWGHCTGQPLRSRGGWRVLSQAALLFRPSELRKQACCPCPRQPPRGAHQDGTSSESAELHELHFQVSRLCSLCHEQGFRFRICVQWILGGSEAVSHSGTDQTLTCLAFAWLLLQVPDSGLNTLCYLFHYQVRELDPCRKFLWTESLTTRQICLYLLNMEAGTLVTFPEAWSAFQVLSYHGQKYTACENMDSVSREGWGGFWLTDISKVFLIIFFYCL